MTGRRMRMWAVGLLLCALGHGAQAQTFRAAKVFNLAGTISDATGLGALADIGSNGGGPDGKLDFLTASQVPQINVLFGRGDGTFSSGPSTDLGVVPTALAVGDLTGDQVIDVLIGDNGSAVTLWRGRNDGTFESAGDPIDVGLVPRGLAIVDVNRDGKLDVLATGDSSQQAGAVRVLFGNNDGTLTPGLELIATGSGSAALVAGDFNGDGKLDVAVANEISNNVTVLRGDGSGGFTFVQNVGSGGDSPIAIGTADFTGDRRLDLVVANTNSDNIAVMDGRGDGSFNAPRVFSSGSSASTPRDLALGDIDDDGRTDVVVVNNFSFDAGVLYGEPNGQFSAPRLFVVDSEPVGVVVGDLNGDGADDVVGMARGSGNSPTVGVLLSLGDRTLNGVQNLVVDVNPTQVIAADLNSDGLPDVAVGQGGTGSQPGTVRIMHASPATGFGDPETLTSAGDTAGLASGDFNGDGRADLAIINRSTSNVSVFITNPAGGFRPIMNTGIGAGVNAIISGDWNGDGRSDLAVATQGDGTNGIVQVLLANANGSFATPVAATVGQLPVALDSGDFNRDGKLDLIVANNGSSNLSVMLGNGNGSFQAPTSVAVTGGPRSVAVADFDRDGFDDVAVSLSITSSAVVLFGDGTGRFPAASRALSLGGVDTPSGISARDVNGDGNPDVILGAEVSSTVKTFLRSAAPNTRFFSSAETIAVNRRPISVATADFDGDGRYDAAAAASSPAPTTSVLTNIRALGFLRGDGNGDAAVSAADVVAVMRKLKDGSGIRVEDVGVRGNYVAAPGVDANGDGIVTLPDVLGATALIFNAHLVGL